MGTFFLRLRTWHFICLIWLKIQHLYNCFPSSDFLKDSLLSIKVIMLNIPPINYNPNPKGHSLGIKQKCKLFLLYFYATKQRSL